MLELSVLEIFRELDRDRIPRKELPIRYLPLQVIARAKKHLKKTKDALETAKYVLYSFYVFRETVNRDMFAPHHPYFGAYQWPTPSKFSWGNINAVCAIGESIHGNIPEKEKGVIIQTRENGKIIETILVPEKRTQKTNIRDIVHGKDNLREVLEYRVDISKTDAFLSNWWQHKSLEEYVSPLHKIAVGCHEGRISKKEAAEKIDNLLDRYKKKYMIE